MVHITHILFIFTALLCLFSVLNAPMALLTGMVFAVLGWVPKHLPLAKWTKHLLAIAIVLLGFRVFIPDALTLLLQNGLLIGTSILLAFAACLVFAKGLGVDRDLSTLLGAGTAICGGSAIAAVSPVIQAKNSVIGIALGCVFLLNALALWLFPAIGRLLELTELQFGVWAAIAIHDTASVVAAAAEYGEEAMATATTLKLARALAIIPLVFIIAWFVRRKDEQQGSVKTIYFPWFIGGFVVTASLASFLPWFPQAYASLARGGQHLLTLCVFLIGAGLSPTLIKQTGWRALCVAVGAWICVSGFALWWVLAWPLN